MNPLIAKETKVLIVDDQVLAKGYMKYSLEELGFSDITYVDKVHLALNKIRQAFYCKGTRPPTFPNTGTQTRAAKCLLVH